MSDDPLLDFMESRGLGPSRDMGTPGTGKESNDLGAFFAEAKARRAAPPPVGSKADLLGTASLVKKEFLEGKREQISLDRFIDGDSVRGLDNPDTGERGTSMRLGYARGDERYVDSPETWHGEEFNKKRMETYSGRKADFRQRAHLADQLGVDIDDLTSEQREKAGMDALAAIRASAMEGQEDQLADPFLTISQQGTDRHGRPISVMINPYTGKNILDSQNTPELNTDYDSGYNVGIRREIAERKIVEDDAVAAQRAKTAAVSDEMMDNPIGQVANAFAYGVSGVARSGAWIANLAPEQLAFAGRSQVSNDNKILFASRREKEQERIKAQNAAKNKEAPGYVKAWARESIKSGKFDLTPEEKALDNTPGMLSAYELMKGVEGLESGVIAKINKAKDYYGSLVNRRSEQEAMRRNEKVWGQASKDWGNGVQAYKEGRTGDAVKNVASSIGSWLSGFADTATTNPAAVAGTFIESYPQMMMALGKGGLMAASSLGMATDIASRGRKDFIKEHGREPDTKEVAVIWAMGLGSALAEKAGAHGIFDSFKKKAISEVGKETAEKIIKSATAEATKKGIVSKTLGIGVKAVAGTAKAAKGVVKANVIKRPVKGFVTETTTEFGQGVAEDYAGKQDLKKVNYGQAYGESVLGGLSGGGAAAVIGVPESLGIAETGVAKVVSKAADAIGTAKSKARQAKNAIKEAGTPEAMARAVDKTDENYSPKNAVITLTKKYNETEGTSSEEHTKVLSEMREHQVEQQTRLQAQAKKDSESGTGELSSETKSMLSDIGEINATINALVDHDPAAQGAVTDLSDSDVTKHTPEARASVAENIAGKVFGSEDLSVFDDIKDPETQELVKAGNEAIKARKAFAASQVRTGRDKAAVHGEVMADSISRWGKNGLELHTATITDAIQAGDIKAAKEATQELQGFLDVQRRKHMALMNAADDLAASSDSSVKVLWDTDANRKEPFILNEENSGAAQAVAQNNVMPEIKAIEAEMNYVQAMATQRFGSNKVAPKAGKAEKAPEVPPVTTTATQSEVEQAPDLGTAEPKSTVSMAPVEAPKAKASNPTSSTQEAVKTPTQRKPKVSPTPDLELTSPPTAPGDIKSDNVIPFKSEGPGAGVFKAFKAKITAKREKAAATKKANQMKPGYSRRKPSKASQRNVGPSVAEKIDNTRLKYTEENLAKMGIGSHVYGVEGKNDTGRNEYIVEGINNAGMVTLANADGKGKKIRRHIANLRSEPAKAPRTAEQIKADEERTAADQAKRKADQEAKDQAKKENDAIYNANQKRGKQDLADSGLEVNDAVEYKGDTYNVLATNITYDGTVEIDIAKEPGGAPDHTASIAELTLHSPEQETASPSPATPKAATAQGKKESTAKDETYEYNNDTITFEEMSQIPEPDLDSYAQDLSQQEAAEEILSENDVMEESDNFTEVPGADNTVIESNEEIQAAEEQAHKEQNKRPDPVEKAKSYVRELKYVQDSIEEDAKKWPFRNLIKPIKAIIARAAKMAPGVIKSKLKPLFEKANALLTGYRRMDNFGEVFGDVSQVDQAQPFYRRMRELANTSYRQPDARSMRDGMSKKVMEDYKNPDIDMTALNLKVEANVFEFQTVYGFPNSEESLLSNGDKALGEQFEGAQRKPSSLFGVVSDFFDRLIVPGVVTHVKQIRNLDAQDIENTKFFKKFNNEFKENLEKVHEFRYGDKDKAEDMTRLFREGALNEFQGSEAEKLLQSALPENVISALAMGTLNWMGTQGTTTLNKPDSAINRFMGRDSKADVGTALDLLMRQSGKTLDSIVKDIGAVAAKQLNIRAKDDADGYVQAKMEAALGLAAVKAMEKMGLVEVNIMTQADLNPMRSKTEIDNVTTPEAQLFFVRIQGKEDTRYGGMDFDPNTKGGEIIKNFKEEKYSDTLEKLFGMQDPRTGPHDAPVKGDPITRIKGSIQTPSKTHQEGHQAAREMAYGGKKQSFKLLNKMRGKNDDGSTDNDYLYRMGGMISDMSTVHTTNEKSVQAVNKHIQRQFEHVDDFMEGREVEKDFYFDYQMVSNLRMMEISNTITPQGSKIHRFLFGIKSWETDVDLGSEEQINNLEVAIAGAFDIGADKLTHEAVRDDFHENIMRSDGTFVNGKIAAGVVATRKALFSDSELTAAEKEAIVVAVGVGGEKFHTYDGLVALTQYSEALNKGLDTVEGVYLSREVDGTTNGPISGVLQMGLSYEDAVDILKAGGVHFKDDPDSEMEYGEYISRTGKDRKYDNYQALAIIIDKHINDHIAKLARDGDQQAVEKGQAMQRLLGDILSKEVNQAAQDLTDLQEAMSEDMPPIVTGRGRNLNKPLVMTSAYGSGLKKILENLKLSVEANIYEDMMKGREKPDVIARKLSDLNKIGAYEIDATVKTPEERATFFKNKAAEVIKDGTVKEFELNNTTRRALENAMDEFYKDPMELALEEQLGPFRDNRDRINEGLRIINEIFSKIYNREVDNLKKELKRNPNKTELRELAMEMRDSGMFPMVQHATSDSADFSTYLELSKKDSVKIMTPEGRVHSQVSGANEAARKKNSVEGNHMSLTFDADGTNPQLVEEVKEGVTTSLNHNISIMQYIGDIGVSGFPLLNVHMDATIQAMAMAAGEMLNVFDAQILGINDVTASTLRVNKMYRDTHAAWAMADSVDEAVTRLMEFADGQSKHDPAGKYHFDDPSFWSDMESDMEMTLRVDSKNKKAGHYSIPQFVDSLHDKLKKMGENKRAIMDRVNGMDQYPDTDAMWRADTDYNKPEVPKEIRDRNDKVKVEEAALMEEMLNAPKATLGKGLVSNPEYLVVTTKNGKEKRERKISKNGYNINIPGVETALLAVKGEDNKWGVIEPLSGRNVSGMAFLTRKAAIESLSTDVLGRYQNINQFNTVIDKVISDYQRENREGGKDFGSDSSIYSDVTPVSSQPLEVARTQQIFDDLAPMGNVRETPEHATYLKDFMDRAIIPVMQSLDTFTLFKGKSASNNKGKSENIGRNRNIYVAGAAGIVKAGIEMSAQEVMVHELGHAVWVESIGYPEDKANNVDKMPGIPRMRNSVEKMYKLAEAEIKVEDFLRRNSDGSVKIAQDMATEMAAAQARYDHVFNNADGYLHEFATMGTTNAAFMKALERVDMQQVRKILGEGKTLPEMLFALFMNAVDWIASKTIGKNERNVATALQHLAGQINTINNGQQNKIDAFSEKAMKTANAAAQKVLIGKALPAYKKVAAFSRKHKDKNRATKIIAGALNLPLGVANDKFRQGMNDAAYDMEMTKDNMAYKLATEVSGASTVTRPFHKLLRYSKKYREQAKEEITNHMKKQMLHSFVDGKKFKEATWIALNDVGFKADLGVLFEGGERTWKDITKILENQADRSREIKDTKAELERQFPKYYELYIHQAESLGHLIAKGEATTDNQMWSAHNIANLGGTQGIFGKAEGDLNVAQEIIDRLATLYGVQHTDQTKRVAFADVMRTEYTNNPTENGIQFMLAQQKAFKQDSLEQLFQGDDALMQKGWTSENYDEYRSSRVATADMADALKDSDGFIEYSPIQQDDLSSDQGDLRLFITKDGSMRRTVTGVMSRTNKNMSGADILQQQYDAGMEDGAYVAASTEFHEHKDKALQAMRAQFNGTAKQRPDNNFMIPVVNNSGDIVNYRYTMNEATKVNGMGKKDLAHETMGRMLGTLVDKVQSQVWNEKALLELKRDFDENFRSDRREFIKIGPNVANEKHAEIYRLIPKDGIRDLERIFGKKEMYVREELLDLVFGYRKASITEWLDNKFDGQLPRFIKRGMMIAGDIWIHVVGKAKKHIVLFMPLVLIGNIASNFLLSIMKGVPPLEMFREQANALKYLTEYQKNRQEQMTLENLIKSAPNHTSTKNRRQRIKRLQTKMEMSPIHPLIDEGLFQTMVEDISLQKDGLSEALLNALPDAMSNSIRDTGEIIPSKMKDVYHTLTLSPSDPSGIADMLTKATQYSDFVARYALYQHHLKKGMSKEDAINDVIDTFINYDIPTSPQMQWLNDMGLLMYTKFLFRIQRVIAKSLVHTPGTAAGIQAAQMVLGDSSDVMEYNLLTKQWLAGNGVAWRKIADGPFGGGHLDSAYEANLINAGEGYFKHFLGWMLP